MCLTSFCCLQRLKQLFTIKNVCRLRAKLVREQGGIPEQSVLASIIVMDEIQLAASKLERLCKIDPQTALKTILKAVCDNKSLYSGKDFHGKMCFHPAFWRKIMGTSSDAAVST